MTASRSRTVVEERESTREGRLAMAGARAAVSTVTLINRAVETSGCTRADLAVLLGVTPGRVSQVLNGDGNLRVSTVARFLRAAGYRLKLTAEPVEAGVAPIRQPVARRPKPEAQGPRYAAFYTVTTVTDDGVGPEPVIQLSASHPSKILGRPTAYNFVLDMETGDIEHRTTPPSAKSVSSDSRVAAPVQVHRG